MSIHKSWIAGPVRASSKSTKCGPPLAWSVGVHKMLPGWQSPCRRIILLGCSAKMSFAIAIALSHQEVQVDCWSNAITLFSKSQSRESIAKVCRFNMGRVAKACLCPTLCMRAIKRPTHSSTSTSSNSGIRPPRRGLTLNAKPAAWCKVLPFRTNGPTTGISSVISSAANACSSSICASLQRSGR